MALTLEEAIRQINNNVDTMPKAISMSQAEQIDTTESILNAIPEYRDNKIERFAKGLYAGLDTVRDVLPSIELYGKNADLAIGGYFGASEEEISRKAMNIATIQRNLMANQKDRAEYTSEETAESFAYGLGQGAANLLMMYASGGAAGAVAKSVAAKTAVGIATGTALENIEQQSERMPVNKLGELEVEKITPEWAKKSTIGTTSYLAASFLLEKKVGFGNQTTLWETPIKFSNQTLKNISPVLKTAGKGLLSEGATEGLQSLTSSGILLAEGTIKMSDMPERLQQAWKEAVIGGILGGSVGTAVAINQQVNVKTMLNEEIGKVVADPNEREAIVEAIYESGTVELTNVISKELELSSELNTKHGAIYDSMQNAIHSAIQESGSFAQESEEDVAQYVAETSKMFANQVLAEANKRGCLIDDVLKASDIKYEDGKIKLQAGKETIAETEVGILSQEEKEWGETLKRRDQIVFAFIKRAAETKNKKYSDTEIKMFLGMIKSGKNYKKGISKRLEEFLDVILQPDGRITVKGWDPSFGEFFNETDFEEGNDEKIIQQALNYLANRVKSVDPTEERAKEQEEIINRIKNKFNDAKTFDELFSLFDNEVDSIPKDLWDNSIESELSISLEQNIERLENEQGRFKEKSERDTREASKSNLRTVQEDSSNIFRGSFTQENEEINPDILFQSANTAGADSAEFSDAKKEWEEKGTDSKYFKNWFGDSKVVDEDGKPLVVYHGSVQTFEVFDKEKASAEGNVGAGFYFTDNEDDVDDNYYDGGPDFDNKVERLAEQIQQDEDIDYDEAKERAEAQLRGESKKYPVYLAIKNPVYIGGNKETNLYDALENYMPEVNEEDYEDYDEYEEARYQAEDEAFQTISYQIDDKLGDLLQYDDIEKAKGILFELFGNQYVTFEELRERLNQEYFENWDTGELVSNEVARRIAEALGYDGIIDSTVTDKFKNMGIQTGTSHYIAFEPEQIKSVDNRGTFDVGNDNIYFQLKSNPKNPEVRRGSFIVSEKAIELFKDADYSTLPHEFAHFWLDNMWSYYNSGLASEAYKNNFQAVIDFLHIKPNQIFIKDTQHERFADAYEKYLLNGYAPNGLIQGAFDEYDRWLQKVYKDASDLKVKLTADAIEFFDSMTTGELQPYTVEETNREVVKKEVIKTVNDAKKVAVEANSVYKASPMINSTVPVETEGEKAQSRVYTNQSDILGLAEELDYNKVSIEEQNAKAKAFVKANLAAAQRIVNGLEQPPADILKNAIYNAYLKEMLAIGNTEAYVNALRNQSLELTRAGQEIASQRGAIENIFDSTYWIRRIENRLKEIKAVEKFGDLLDGVNEINAVNKLEKYIDTEITKVLDSFINATEEEQSEIVKNLVKNLSAELNSKPPEELYQRLREPSEVRTRTNAYNYLYRAVNEGLGLSLSSQQVNEIINKTSAIQKSIENTKDRNGNPSALFFKNMAEMENYANSIAPSPALSVLTSTIGRGNMLMSVKSIALNIESNILNFISESVIKRISYGTVDKLVDTNVIKEYLEYSKGVFNSSGYQVSTMEELDATQRILSEKQITSQGDGVIRALGRFYEQTIFKYGLGYPDLVFKDLAFVDSVNLLASKEANGDSKKATAIFKDAILLQPKTPIGQAIREKAQIDALVATYQNKSALSEAALTVRNALNKWSGKLKLGDALNPFVKTPANVLALGIDYTFGAYALKDIQTIVSDFQRGQITDTSKNALRKIGRNAIGVLIAIALSSLIDDEDYIPDYALLSPSERNLVKAQNGVFNAVKIGNKWVSLDYFGPFAMPLAAVLNAKKEKALQDKVFNYLTGAGIQGLKIPVFGNLAETFQTAGRLANQDATKGAGELINSLVDFTSSRLTPAILSDIAKITDDYERDTGKSALNRAMTRIPVIREQLPAKVNYATGRAVETENALSVLLAGARVKEATKGAVIREFDKLANAQTDKKVTLSGVTKGNSLLSKLPESEKPKVEAKFAKMYSSEVSKLIKTNYYNNLDNENKVKAINKIRDKAVESLKKEYGLGKKGVKRK